MAPMWKYKSAVGEILKITKDYVVVKWDDVPGHWHYTEIQAEKIHIFEG